MTATMLVNTRAEALFLSDVSASTPLTRDEATAAIRRTLQRHHGVRGCAIDFAAEYGEHPETSPARMQWAVCTVRTLFCTHNACVALRMHPRAAAGR